MRKPIKVEAPGTRWTTIQHEDYDASMRVLKEHCAALSQEERDILGSVAGTFATGSTTGDGHAENSGCSIAFLRKCHAIISRFEPIA